MIIFYHMQTPQTDAMFFFRKTNRCNVVCTAQTFVLFFCPNGSHSGLEVPLEKASNSKNLHGLSQLIGFKNISLCTLFLFSF
jgi:hypothetical protein